MAKHKESVAEILAHGPISSWNVHKTPIYTHGKYAVRLELIFADGTTQKREHGGYKSQKDAEKKCSEIIAALTQKTYMAFKMKTHDFLEYWLFEYMARRKRNPISYQTFSTYKSKIKCHINPEIGDMYLHELTTETLVNLIQKKKPATAEHIQTIMYSALKYAVKMHLLSKNPANNAILYIRKQNKKKKKREQDTQIRNNPDADIKDQTKRQYALEAEQTSYILAVAKDRYPSLFIALILACVTGCRISELIAIRYRDVDYEKKVIRLTAQLGRPIDISGLEPGEILSCRMPTKSLSGVRTIPMPDFALDEILASRIRWEQTEASQKFNTDDITVWHQDNGRPYTRYGYARDFKKLKADLGMPEDFHWHDLRHSYATIMAEHDVNIKELSAVLGHSRADFTLKTYVVSKQPIYNIIPEYGKLLEDTFPFTIQCPLPGKQQETFDVGEYLDLMEGLMKECTDQRSPCRNRENTV